MKQNREPSPDVVKYRRRVAAFAAAVAAFCLAGGALVASGHSGGSDHELDPTGRWDLVAISDAEGELDWNYLNSTPWVAIGSAGELAYSDGCNTHFSVPDAPWGEPLLATVENGRLVISGGPAMQTLVLCGPADLSKRLRPDAGASLAWMLRLRSASGPEVQMSADGSTLELRFDDLVAVLEARHL